MCGSGFVANARKGTASGGNLVGYLASGGGKRQALASTVLPAAAIAAPRVSPTMSTKL